ncbi:MAG: flagellar biosynthetic protein FliO [Rhodoferax sp.]|uniref:FliO/MopB family protein n=1 Tax=Rhodoferax sp. TaxID=50421 RepID=UPI00261F74A7|nr:flagellar biosynthetic protein FliO [Rhodoferax sp.]MDD2880979.1 flagellar biosynthetic protein FliO [Rhodoferax sp.]
MWQAWVSVVLFVVLLALVPVALKWVQRRAGGGLMGTASATRIVSAVGVGPHQRVVTVEVGPEGARVWLTLGVTAQNITCLHTAAAPVGAAVAADATAGRLPTTLS